MITLNYITGKEAVASIEDDFESFKEYYESDGDCIRSKEFESEKEMQSFVAGLGETGTENYYILDEKEASMIEEL